MYNNENEHDITKNMIDTIRNSKRIIKEDMNSSKAIELSGTDLQEEENKFREFVSDRVDFHTFKIYPQDSNVIFAGKFQHMNNMEWQYSLVDTKGVYINANNLQLTPDAVELVRKLAGYYDNWAGEWGTKLATEYKNQKNNI